MKQYFLLFCIMFCSCKSRIDNKQHPIQDSIFYTVQKLILPIKFEIKKKYDNNYYENNLDSFLWNHFIKRDTTMKFNSLFSDSTVDFVSEDKPYFMHYPYKGQGSVIGRIDIGAGYTALLFAYLYQSDITQPRIEIQVFNNVLQPIDKLILASVFTSECSGYREFSIDKQLIITIRDNYRCYDFEDDKEGDLFKNEYRYKVNSSGKIEKIKIVKKKS